ncbi:carboxypeptidase-like regulatory domain-containing protein [Ferruginibacter sp. SUN106]|uniref:carboxypeptidase-like regulatory domain-containing protein n=1 Tax=Ferruginibacter sp. SUN106 TaxID=2978348 RepID=UPI003D35A90F
MATSVLSNYINEIVISIALVFIISSSQAQTSIKGKVLYEKDGKPAPFASVKLINRSNGTVSDTAGNFSLPVRNYKQTDTILITSVGYENLKLPVQQAIRLHEFKLQESQKVMESVVIRSFSKEEVAGAKNETVGYYRSWNTDNTGGEIGRTFLPNHKEYQVAKVRFKVYNTYDTCLIRIHIREVNNFGEPGKELLQDSVAQVLSRSSLADKAYEFDLNKYNVVLNKKNIFVSFEVLKGGQTDNTSRSLSFIGSEEGSYLYKSGEKDSWHSSDAYTIYMKLLLKYDD